MKAAKTLFGWDGFRGASLASVAEAARLSQPGLRHAWPMSVASCRRGAIVGSAGTPVARSG